MYIVKVFDICTLDCLGKYDERPMGHLLTQAKKAAYCLQHYGKIRVDMLASTQLSHRPTDLQLELKYLKNQVYCNINTVTSLNILMQRLNVIYKKFKQFFFRLRIQLRCLFSFTKNTNHHISFEVLSTYRIYLNKRMLFCCS